MRSGKMWKWSWLPLLSTFSELIKTFIEFLDNTWDVEFNKNKRDKTYEKLAETDKKK